MYVCALAHVGVCEDVCFEFEHNGACLKRLTSRVPNSEP